MTKLIKVRNPRSGEFDYEICAASAADIAAIAGELRRNQSAWRDLGVDGRIGVFKQWQSELERLKQPIIAAVSEDTGRHAISEREYDGLLRSIDRWCTLAPGILAKTSKPSQDLPGVEIQQRLDPFPLVGAISPWNFPLLLSFIDTVPALLAGCAVIIKPSEVTPRFVEPVAQAIAAVPELEAILRFIAGDGKTGADLIECIDVVAFTGSVATGRKVARAAAEAFIPAYLELGGKDPAVLLPGTDLERAATSILRASVAATGQACQSLERIYVHDSQRDAFLALLCEKAQAVELSYPDAHSGTIGPLIFARQAAIIRDHLDDAIARGALVHTGGEIIDHDGSQWIAPTVISQVDHTMRIMRDETFGPVMPVMAYATEEEAIALANDCRYGLSAAVFGPTEEDALRVAERIDAGAISVNDAGMTTMVFDGCKMSYKESGMGPSRSGRPGMERYLRQKALFVNRGGVLPIDIMAEH